MTKHVISTLTADNQYNEWVDRGGINERVRSVLVRGGTGVANKQFVTSEGVSTAVSNEDAAFLLEHGLFKQHMERGFVKIINMDRNPETVAQSMSKDDGSRPRVADDVAKFANEKKLDKDEKISVRTNTATR